MFQSTSH